MLLLGSLLCGGTAHAVTTEEHGVRVVQQEGTCTGTVLDETGLTVIGASVVIKGNTSVGSVTDLDGKFSIPSAKRGDVLRITYVGYQPIEVTWEGKPLIITLKEDSEMLDEVVVVGYGTQKKKYSNHAPCRMWPRPCKARFRASP